MRRLIGSYSGMSEFNKITSFSGAMQYVTDENKNVARKRSPREIEFEQTPMDGIRK